MIDRVLLAGDTHGQAGWIKWLCKRAVSNDCEVILQLGDFGFWEHKPHGRVFLDDVARHLELPSLNVLSVKP